MDEQELEQRPEACKNEKGEWVMNWSYVEERLRRLDMGDQEYLDSFVELDYRSL